MPTQMEQIQALRDKTGAGMMDCKKAITEAAGDFDKALEFLRKKGLADAAKKSVRTTKEGVIAVKIEGSVGAIIELNCETDFVAKNEDYVAFADKMASNAGAGKTDEAAVKEAVIKFGENLVLRRSERFELQGTGLLSGYVHPSGRKTGAMIEIGAANDAAAKSPAAAELAKELLLQVVAMGPKWVKAEDVPADVVAKEREIYSAQVKNEGKPEASIPKIVEGKLNKLFFGQSTLMSQVSMRDNKTPIAQLVKDASGKAGGDLSVRRFVAYRIGE